MYVYWVDQTRNRLSVFSWSRTLLDEVPVKRRRREEGPTARPWTQGTGGPKVTSYSGRRNGTPHLAVRCFDEGTCPLSEESLPDRP